MTDRLCIYHRADLDGKCAAAIVLKQHPDVELWPANYGDDFDPLFERVTAETEVILVDFSLQPAELMARLVDRAGHVVWIDHHKSAIESVGELGLIINGVRSMDELAGCELAWEHFFPQHPMPRAVWLLGRYDVWAWPEMDEADEIMAFQYGTRNFNAEPTSVIWNTLLNASTNYDARTKLLEDITAVGATILQYQAKQDTSFVERGAFRTVLDGLKVLAANRTPASSQLFASVWPDHPDADAMLAFGWTGGCWRVSLYTDRDGIDVSAICKARGGGGHAQAAGFRCDTLPFALR
jgi:oligoribonuclease NrnB/cAMP/cGMP phosphodiesterase (DHH superfamily)